MKTSRTLRTAYFFFDFNDPQKQTVEGMLRSLVLQFALAAENTPEVLEDLYARHHEKRGPPTQPKLAEWESVLLDMARDADVSYIIIDALDECQEKDVLTEWMQVLINRSIQSIRWLATCQTSDVMFTNLNSAHDKVILMEASTVDDDIATYLQTMLETDVRLRSFSLKAKASIKTKVQSKARGM